MEIVKIPLVLGTFDGVGESPRTVICPMRCGDLTSNPSNPYPLSIHGHEVCAIGEGFDTTPFSVSSSSISAEALFGCSRTSGGCR